jgi:beta-glucuronidase
LGPAWYQVQFDLPWGWREHQVFVRFGSVNYRAQVWLNGEPLGSHEGGHLPFAFEVTSQLREEDNLLVARVDGRLGRDTVPPGNLALEDTVSANTPYPATSFDFFPYCGIHRLVSLYAVPHGALTDVTVTTDILGGDTGHLAVRLDYAAQEDVTARLTLSGQKTDVTHQVSGSDGVAQTSLIIPQAALWSPDAPNLYTLRVELLRRGEVFDRYSLPVGMRTVAVEGDALLLNGQPLRLKGFGRHEDFPVVGRGLVPGVIVKDYALMRWMGANSFRTSHYPYSEQMLDLADRLGFLVIDETPAVGLFFKNAQGLERRLELCRQQVGEMIARDKNHPSVIIWSIANEPKTDHPSAYDFFRELYDLAKSLDSTRPVTLARHARIEEQSFEFLDLVCLNLYYGWYSEYGQLEAGCQRLEAELDAVYHKFKKPILLTEFGADAIPGHHAQPPEMFSEEYQAEMLTRYIEVLDRKPYVVGHHVWNMCDFKTGQAIHRMGGMNYKGVFTRDRRPKLATHRLRELWQGGSGE